jgi:NAD(P)-dependent dehydrogenase (short-subunit alcohol dehydrogenase family)
MFELTGKRALVTGASGAIGGAIARTLHAQGAAVALSGTRHEALGALAGELGSNAHVVPCDLSVADVVAGLVERSEAALGELDILVNNAGLTRDNLFARVADSDWDRVIAVNLTAAFKLSREALRGMVRRRSGRIISITSIVAITGNRSGSRHAKRHYQLCCAGLHSIGHDRCAQRKATRHNHGSGSGQAARHAHRSSGGGGLPGLGRGRVHHRPDDSRQWWYGYDLTKKKDCRRVALRRLLATCPYAGKGSESVLGATVMPIRRRPSRGTSSAG